MPVPNNPHLSALWLSSPTRAAARVQAAIKKAGGNHVHAARALNVGHRTLLRWLRKYASFFAATSGGV